jgi:hypothetical protein
MPLGRGAQVRLEKMKVNAVDPQVEQGLTHSLHREPEVVFSPPKLKSHLKLYP